MNKNQILLEINAAIAAMLDSNWSYFSAPSYMKEFFADGIIRCLLYDDFLWPNIHMLFCNAYVWTFFVRIYMRVCKKMVIYFGIKTPQSEKERKYTFTIYVRVFLPAGMIASVHGKKPHVYRVIIFETNGRPYQRSYYVIRRVIMALSQVLHGVNYKARRR